METETISTNPKELNEDVIRELENIAMLGNIQQIRENIAETTMRLATMPDEYRPNRDYILNVNQFYFLLKAMEHQYPQ